MLPVLFGHQWWPHGAGEGTLGLSGPGRGFGVQKWWIYFGFSCNSWLHGNFMANHGKFMNWDNNDNKIIITIGILFKTIPQWCWEVEMAKSATDGLRSLRSLQRPVLQCKALPCGRVALQEESTRWGLIPSGRDACQLGARMVLVLHRFWTSEDIGDILLRSSKNHRHIQE